MITRDVRADSDAILRQVFDPPLSDWHFWLIQLSVLLIASLHIFADLRLSALSGPFPAGLPVALLIVPVGYAALHFGLTGSAATALWATLLWLPDLMLPNDRGHVGADVINLVLIDLVAFVFGARIESERSARARAERATLEREAAEARFHQLFDSNRAPIVVLDAQGIVTNANPAARALFSDPPTGSSILDLLGTNDALDDLNGRTYQLRDARDYRVSTVAMPEGSDEPSTQLVLEDVTQELSESRRATQYARLVVQVEEDQRRSLARELHDEPLQLFLHLARRLESLASVSGVPAPVSTGLEEARVQALDAATRLRTLARDLRPPSLDQLGLVAALTSLLSDVEEESELATDLVITGAPVRTSPDIELGAYRIAQESVRNVVRHAHAHHVALVVGFAPESLSVSVSDDGHGFEQRSDEDASSAHLGVLGMRERANLLGGRLDIVSGPDGTRVFATIPLARRDPPVKR